MANLFQSSFPHFMKMVLQLKSYTQLTQDLAPWEQGWGNGFLRMGCIYYKVMQIWKPLKAHQEGKLCYCHIFWKSLNKIECISVLVIDALRTSGGKTTQFLIQEKISMGLFTNCCFANKQIAVSQRFGFLVKTNAHFNFPYLFNLENAQEKKKARPAYSF